MNPDDGIERFVIAQQNVYHRALYEIKNGSKQSHWMWFIFPQIKGLGKSTIANYYAIANLKEAEGFLNHPVLAKHLIEICKVLLAYKKKSAEAIFGELDAKKLCSSMTLFSQVENADPVFQEILDVFFSGYSDPLTLLYTAPQPLEIAMAS